MEGRGGRARARPTGGGGGDGRRRPAPMGRPSNPVQQPSSNPARSPVRQPPPPTHATVQSPTSSHHVGGTGGKSVPNVPVKRPDEGGTNAVASVSLRLNHFLVKFKSDGILMHYDVDIKLEAPPKMGPPAKISKSTLYMIKEKLCSDNSSQFPASSIAYDGEKNIFSAVELPTGKFKVGLSGKSKVEEVSEGEEMKICSFIVTINLVKQLELQKLSDYLSGKLSKVPRDILQGMDVVMKENPARRMLSAGRSFYPFQFSGEDELGCGFIASRGLQHSLKPTAQGLSLCVDYSVVPFYKPSPVLNFLEEHVDPYILHDFKPFKSQAADALKGLKVKVTHRNTSQKFTVAGLTDEQTGNLSFLIEDPTGNVLPKKVMLVDYFKEKYGHDIKNKHFPCLDVGRNDRSNYVPMEFCTLAEGQRYPKEKLKKAPAERLKTESLPKPHVRQSKICAMVQANNGPCGGGIIDSFSIDVNKNMTSVAGRVIGPPELKLGGGLSKANVNRMTVNKDRCQWSLSGRSVVEGITVNRWALVDFNAKDKHSRQGTNQFIASFIKQCRNLGIQMLDPLSIEDANMAAFSNFPALEELLHRVYNKEGRKLQILVCVMARKHPGYGYLKWFSETVMGMVTQCCLSRPPHKGTAPYLYNLALKLNAKLGGSNVELIERLPRFEGEGHVMFIGADVNHPGSRNTTSPSIAAVVATVNWPAANRYAARICPQAHRVEKIQNFGGMCMELVDTYARANKVNPEKIVVFRDGVSEGQFDMVLNEELLDLKETMKERNYHPTITLIVVRKRHLTRLFTEGDRKKSSTGNVPPGTVVDTTVVHKSEFDFYLCSHYGTLGTSKPAHYHVLHDDHKFSSDQIQKLTYNLCFTFARCTKSVSLVPPVYYADLAAFRGRLYNDAIGAQARPSAASSSSSVAPSSVAPSSVASSSVAPSSVASSSVASSSETGGVEKPYCLGGALQNTMFFI